ncbi:MAG: NAD(P)/FAD-dependent oxidoreductase [Brevirhabdus sp.]
MAVFPTQPSRKSYDVVIVGGAMIGSAIAWFLKDMGFKGHVLVAERDPGYELTSTAASNSCMRQQFSNELNIRISQFAASYTKEFHHRISGAPQVPIHAFGYLYLATTETAEARLRQAHALQARLGAGTHILTRDALAQAFPFYALDDVRIATHNPVDEGYFDGGAMFDWWRRDAIRGGVEFVQAEVKRLDLDRSRVTGVTLATGDTIACGTLVNAAGPRAASVAAMAGIDLPVEPRKRYTYVFEAADPLPCDLPLTVDPSGVHVRTDGKYYMAGFPPPDGDPAVPADDFGFDHSLWETFAWPAIATRIPAFERIRVLNSWVGHYAYNTLDQNAVLGPHDRIGNFVFANGFSGHGFQQAPAVGRGIAEWIIHGGWQSLDLSPLGFERIRAGRPYREQAVI